jgi:chromosomal replication initiation ATPase DnaA
MSSTGPQLPLSLALPAASGRDDFIVGPANEEAVALVDRWPGWAAPAALLVGPHGSGKSHLAAAFAARAAARIVTLSDLGTADPIALAEAGHVVVEDIDARRDTDTALLHLLNALRQRGRFVLMTASTPPAAWRATVPDLVSRLRAATQVTIAEPDDTLLAHVLVKLFADRQMDVDRSVIELALRRMERSLGAANAFVAALDAAALAAKRAPTRALAAEVLDRMGKAGQ